MTKQAVQNSVEQPVKKVACLIAFGKICVQSALLLKIGAILLCVLLSLA
jgi:hypothetical protein